MARGAFALNMILTFPMECLVAREVIQHEFFHNEFNGFHLFWVTLALVLSALLASVTTCNLGFILELSGGFAASWLGKGLF
jgi:sodium-coupled neutral amino acid transporter 11